MPDYLTETRAGSSRPGGTSMDEARSRMKSLYNSIEQACVNIEALGDNFYGQRPESAERGDRELAALPAGEFGHLLAELTALDRLVDRLHTAVGRIAPIA